MAEPRRKNEEVSLEAPKPSKKASKTKNRDKAKRTRYRDARPDLKRNFRNFCRHGGLAAKDGESKALSILKTDKYSKLLSGGRIMADEYKRLELRRNRKLERADNPTLVAQRRARRIKNLTERLSTLDKELKDRDSLALTIHDLTQREIPTDSYQVILGMCRDPEAIRNDLARLSNKLKGILNAV